MHSALALLTLEGSEVPCHQIHPDRQLPVASWQDLTHLAKDSQAAKTAVEVSLKRVSQAPTKLWRHSSPFACQRACWVALRSTRIQNSNQNKDWMLHTGTQERHRTIDSPIKPRVDRVPGSTSQVLDISSKWRTMFSQTESATCLLHHSGPRCHSRIRNSQKTRHFVSF